MEHKHLIYWSLISLFIIIATSCNKQKKEISDYQKIAQYLEKYHNYKLGISTKKIVIITDNGCPSCNDALSELSSKSFIGDSTTLLVITGKGTFTDISPFVKKRGNKNIIFDWSADMDRLPLLVQSSVVYLDNNEVDTLININSEQIYQQLDYIRNR